MIRMFFSEFLFRWFFSIRYRGIFLALRHFFFLWILVSSIFPLLGIEELFYFRKLTYWWIFFDGKFFFYWLIFDFVKLWIVWWISNWWNHDRVHYVDFLNNNEIIPFFESWRKEFFFCWFFFWLMDQKEWVYLPFRESKDAYDSTKPFMDWWNRVRSMLLKAGIEMNLDQCFKKQRTMKNWCYHL